MVDYCANPRCMKPLLYLREGAVYIFETAAEDSEGSARSTHQLQHYWLCGECSMAHKLERTTKREVRLVSKQAQGFVRRPAQSAKPVSDRVMTAKIA